MKDYYAILEVTPESGEEQIRKNYRRLAMQYHPDRNPDKPDAEEKFKEIAEAYGVLTDPVKRQQYDASRAMGGFGASGTGGGFQYSQEDILRDLFRDPRFQQMFSGLLQEFARRGFRANQHFIQKSFFGGKGGMIFGGLFFLGSLAGPAILDGARRSLPSPKGVLRSIGGAVGRLLSGGGRKQLEQNATAGNTTLYDTTYTARLTSEELIRGKVLQLVTPGPDGQERLKVKVPPGSHAGQKLRIKGKGAFGPDGRGDLYLVLERG